MIYFLSYKNVFCGLFSKLEIGVCLENATMVQIQDMFENGNPDIVLKTVKGLI